MIEHVRRLQEALTGCEPAIATAERWGAELAELLPAGGRLLVAGNGGSAAQAQHLSAEIVGRYRDDRAPYSAISLHTDTSAVTAIVNDYGVEQLYARQVLAHGRLGDVCLLMSTSGRSANIVAAATAAHAAGLRVWAMCGAGPNPLTDVAHESLLVDTPETATVQEVHLVALHVICEAFDAALVARERAGRQPASASS